MDRTRHFLTFLAITILLTSCGKSDAGRITGVLAQCAKISHNAGSISQDPSTQARYVAEEFQKVDVTKCPLDFRLAFQKHVFAWQQAEPSLKSNTVGTAFIEGFLSGMAADPRFLGLANDQAAIAVQEINSTYRELTLVAAEYGASIPTSVVGR